MIKGVHIVRKARRNKPPFWYVYAYRGGPQVGRFEGWERPRLGADHLRRLIAAQSDLVSIRRVETLGSLARDWRSGSPEWQQLSPNTKKTWGSALDAIEHKWSETPLSVWNDPRMTAKVVAWRDTRADTPRAADIGVSVLRALLKFGRLRGKVNINVAEGIPQIYRNANRAEIVWTEEDLAKFANACKELNCTHVNDGVRLASLTGLRREDLITLTWDEIRGDAIIKKAKKSSRGKRRTVVVPRTRELDALLDALACRERKPGVATVLVNSKGLAWTGDGFGHAFGRARDAADIVHVDPETREQRKKNIHDLRGTFCTKLIIAGLSNGEAAEIMGWSPEQVARIRRTYVDQTAINVAIAARLREGL